MAAGNLTIVGTATANKIAVTDTEVVANLNADQVDGADKDTDVNMAADSDAKIPSQKAVKSYIDTKDAQNVKLTGNQTVAGTKTFSSPISGSIGGSAGGIKEVAASVVLKTKLLEIGDWNMDTNQLKNVAHGLGASWKKIRSVSVIVRNDADTLYLSLLGHTDSTASYYYGGGVDFNVTNIILGRATTGKFDSADYNSTSYNRGWVTIQYEE